MDDQERGYDAAFVSDTPDYLRCPICHLVLRDPVLVISCGHKYCKPCFNYMRTLAGASVLLCPIDRNVIDLTKVCDESGLRRTVGELVVKCGFHEIGCIWEGQLSDLNAHEKQCRYNRELNQQQHKLDGEVLNKMQELQSRMDRYEASLEKKDKDLAHMKMKWQEEVDELKQNGQRMILLVEDLKQENVEMKERLDTVKENETQGRTVEELKEEIAVIKMQVENLKNKFEEEETQISRNSMMKLTSSQVPTSSYSSVLSHGDTETKDPDLTNVIRKLMPDPLKVYRGSGDNVLITSENHLNFAKQPTIVGIPSARVCLGDKVYFEVTCTDIWENGAAALGWASHDFKPSSEKFDSFCRVHGVKWYFPQSQSCYEGGREKSPHMDRYGYTYFGIRSLDSEFVIGVGIDMKSKGNLMYSFNGKWGCPFGVAFKNLDRFSSYFPVLGGKNITLRQNLGETEFKYAPPDPSYKKCNVLFT